MAASLGLSTEARPVSVLDMLSLHAGAFVRALADLRMLRVKAEEGLAIAPDGGRVPVYGAAAALLRPILTSLQQTAADLDARMVKLAVDRVLGRLASNTLTYIEVPHELNDIERRFTDELSTRRVFALAGDADRWWESTKRPLFGPVVAAAFPSAAADIAEAGKCFALDRHTACVLHLMRALEPAVAALAASLGVDMERATWGKVLDRCEAGIRDRNVQRTDEDRQWQAEAAAHLRFVKNAWRDHAMHGKTRYGSTEAREQLDHVGALLRQLSEKLCEPGAEMDVFGAQMIERAGGR